MALALDRFGDDMLDPPDEGPEEARRREREEEKYNATTRDLFRGNGEDVREAVLRERAEDIFADLSDTDKWLALGAMLDEANPWADLLEEGVSRVAEMTGLGTDTLREEVQRAVDDKPAIAAAYRLVTAAHELVATCARRLERRREASGIWT